MFNLLIIFCKIPSSCNTQSKQPSNKGSAAVNELRYAFRATPVFILLTIEKVNRIDIKIYLLFELLQIRNNSGQIK